jgi:glycosyltransferase involved in cell wall biosynthesis
MTLQLGMTAAKTRGGGVDRYYFSLLRELPELGVGVRGLVVGDPEATAASGEVSVFAPEGAGMLRRWSALRGAVAGVGRTDLVVSHFAPYAFPVLDRVRNRPLVVHFHGPWALESAVEGAGRFAVAAKRTLEHLVYRRASRFIVLSRAFAKILAGEYGVREDRIRIVPGGVDVARFRGVGTRAEARRALGWEIDRPTVVTVRRLVHAKGLENLIDAAQQIRAAVPGVQVVIVGTGPLAAELQRRVRELDLEQTIRFAGYVAEDDLPSVYRAADLFVVPTIALEGFGLVVVEALACGTPVLVTPIAGLPEVVRDLDPSLILPGTSARDIASGVTAALTGAHVLPSEENCIAYAGRFDWPVIAARVRDVYREVA